MWTVAPSVQYWKGNKQVTQFFLSKLPPQENVQHTHSYLLLSTKELCRYFFFFLVCRVESKLQKSRCISFGLLPQTTQLASSFCTFPNIFQYIYTIFLTPRYIALWLDGYLEIQHHTVECSCGENGKMSWNIR